MANWTGKKCFNFRHTAAFVTDLTNETGVYDSPANWLYPTVFSFVGQTDTVTAGWTTAGQATADRVAAPTAGIEFAGINYTSNPTVSNPQIFRIDLPATGSYTVAVAFGDVTAGTYHQYYTLLDGSTVIAGPYSDINTTIGAFADSSSAVVTPTSYANWLTIQTPVTATFATKTFFLNIGFPTGGNPGTFTVLSHLEITQNLPSIHPAVVPTQLFVMP